MKSEAFEFKSLLLRLEGVRNPKGLGFKTDWCRFENSFAELVGALLCVHFSGFEILGHK